MHDNNNNNILNKHFKKQKIICQNNGDRPPFNPSGFIQSQKQQPPIKDARLEKQEDLLERMYSNVMPNIYTITNNMDLLITKEANNSASIRSLEVQMGNSYNHCKQGTKVCFLVTLR